MIRLDRAFTRLAAILMLSATITACGGDGDGPTGLDPNEFELVIISGGGNTGIAGTVLTQPLTVRVRRKSSGAPEAGVRVMWAALASGKPTRASSSTNSNGDASTLVELQATGTVVVTAVVDGLPSVTFSGITVLPAPTLQSVTPASADPGDTVDVAVNDLPQGLAPRVLFDGVEGQLVDTQQGTPSTLRAVVPPPVGVCSATTHPAEVRVRVGGVTTGAQTLNVTVPANPFQVGQVLVVEAAGGASGDVQCALLPSDGATAKYLVVALSAELEKAGTFQVSLGSNNIAVSRSNVALESTQSPSFHTSLRAFERRLIERNVPFARPAARDVALFADGPEVGSKRDFWVINDIDAPSGVLGEEDFDRVTATLKFKGANTLLYVDDRSPPGLSDAELATLGEQYDQILYEADLDFFGDNSDVDDNGRVFVLLTPTVNALTPAGSQSGFIVGFFFGLDLFDSSTPSCPECQFSNGGEIFYGFVVDENGQFSDPRSKSRVQALLPPTMIHETQHMINFNWKVLQNGLFSLETLWLSEAEAHIAEELGGDVAFDLGETQLANDLYLANFARASTFLPETHSHSLTAIDGGGSLEERGAGWLFLRWVAEQYGDFIMRRLTQAAPFGVANVEAQTGEDFFRLFADWAVTLWADDQNIPNLPDRYQIQKWDLRSIVLVDPPGGGDPVYALQPMQTTFQTFRNTSIQQTMAATSAFYLEIEAINDLGALQLELNAAANTGIAILRYQ